MSDMKRAPQSSKGAKRRPRQKKIGTENTEMEATVGEALAPEDPALERSRDLEFLTPVVPESSGNGNGVDTTVIAVESMAPSEPVISAPAQKPRHEENRSEKQTQTSEPRFRPVDEYTVQTYYDRSAKSFVAISSEFPELKSVGSTRQSALSELEPRIESHLQSLRNRGENVPEALQSRRYPEKLEARISQGLFRKLDLLSRQEKVGLDQLVSELLVSAIEKRNDSGRAQERRPSNQPQHGNSNQPRHQQQQQQHRRGGGPQRSRSYHDTMDNRENFMEYVRNLEKGNWRKK